MPNVPSPYARLNDPEWLRTEYVDRRRTGRDIAAEVGCPTDAVARALERHGIRKARYLTLTQVPVEWLRDQHIERGRSARNIAEELGVAPRSVRRALTAAGIPINGGRLPPELDDADWLIAHDHLDRAEVARMLDVSEGAVSRARRRHGLRPARAARYPQLDDRAWLEQRYHHDRRTQQQIADEIGCARSTVVQAMKRLGISARPPQEERYPRLHDVAWLADQVEAGRSPASIGAEVGCHPTTVTGAMRRYGLR